MFAIRSGVSALGRMPNSLLAKRIGNLPVMLVALALDAVAMFGICWTKNRALSSRCWPSTAWPTAASSFLANLPIESHHDGEPWLDWRRVRHGLGMLEPRGHLFWPWSPSAGIALRLRRDRSCAGAWGDDVRQRNRRASSTKNFRVQHASRDSAHELFSKGCTLFKLGGQPRVVVRYSSLIKSVAICPRMVVW